MPAHATKSARLLLEVTTLLMRSFSARMRQGEQRLEPAHVGILAKLSLGACTLTALAQHQAVRLPTMSKSITLLVSRGWVERSTPAGDRRQAMVKLTTDGRRVFANMRKDAERHVARMLAPLGETQRTDVNAGLETLIGVLSPAIRNERSDR